MLTVGGDDLVVRLSNGPDPGLSLSLLAPQRPWGDYFVDYLVRLSGNGIDATAAVTSMDGDSLDAFIAGIAKMFRGWAGVRTWRSLEDQLSLEAMWHNGGHVTLRVLLRPDGRTETWTVTGVFVVEAGAEMQTLSAALANFFSLAR